MKYIVAGLAFSMALSGCGNQTSADTRSKEHALTAQVEALETENSRLKAENAELRATPSALLADVGRQVEDRHIANAESALSKLSNKFPESQESKLATKLVDRLKEEEEEKAREAARLAALGFNGLKVTAKLSNTESTLQLRSATTSSRWVFDSYGDEWYYKEAEKGQRFITAKVTVSSKDKNPRLMGVAAYVANGAQLERLGTFEYRFARWDDYASYLGNEADYRNDFAHSSSIPFSIAASVNKDDLKGAVYLVATKEGCFTRSADRFRNPPVWYYSSACASLPLNLTLEDFSTGKLAVLKRI